MYFVNDNDAETNDIDDYDGDSGNGVHDNDNHRSRTIEEIFVNFVVSLFAVYS